MVIEDLYERFLDHASEGDVPSAHYALMRESGNCLIRSKDDFVFLLKESGIEANTNMSDSELIDLFVENLPDNPRLALGTSLLVNMHNKQLNADGDSILIDENVKLGYKTIQSFFFDENEPYSLAAGTVDAVAGAVSELSKLGSNISQGQQKKKYGALDLATKKADSKAAITQQILAQRQAEIEAASKQKENSAKTTKTILIVGGALAAITVIGIILYKLRKK